MWQSRSGVEIFLRKAKQHMSQNDINESLIKAIDELTREVKRLDNAVQRARRDSRVSRRF
jgi:site-specific DNA-adenine methylase